MPPSTNLYKILEIHSGASFGDLKKAYYRRAKECHPDLNPGQPEKEEEFKQLVKAFDVLSDPAQRRLYDEQLAFAAGIGEASTVPSGLTTAHNAEPIMDTIADDLLEELIVGNSLRPTSTLQTLMRDLESTARFIRFREAKTQLAAGEAVEAFLLLQQAATESPFNILYHYYLAQTAWQLRNLGLAENHFEFCIKIGNGRQPPQQLGHIRRELDRLRKARLNPFSRIMRLFKPAPTRPQLTDEEEMIQQTARDMARLMQASSPRQLPGKRRRPRQIDKGD